MKSFVPRMELWFWWRVNRWWIILDFVITGLMCGLTWSLSHSWWAIVAIVVYGTLQRLIGTYTWRKS